MMFDDVSFPHFRRCSRLVTPVSCREGTMGVCFVSVMFSIETAFHMKLHVVLDWIERDTLQRTRTGSSNCFKGNYGRRC